MKYKDLITVFVAIFFFLSLGFTLAVNPNMWPLPVVLIVVFVYIVYVFWIKK